MLLIHCEEVTSNKTQFDLGFSALELEQKGCCARNDPFFTISRTREDASSLVVYESEVCCWEETLARVCIVSFFPLQLVCI